MKNKNNNLSFPKFVVGNLPLSAVLLLKEEQQLYFNKKAEDPRQKPSGMTSLFHNGSKAFTLIELLVVVLIIGILSAVALPQYKVAVAKSRLTALKPVIEAIKTAEESYYLANGNYLDKIHELDLSIPCKITLAPNVPVFECDNYFHGEVLENNEKHIRVLYCPANTNPTWSDCWSNYDFAYIVNLAQHETEPNKITCSGRSKLGKSVCKSYQ